ncbi:VOC family protein [Paraflavisolibacter sp. H34]|uniref:VOC family protein n=1 Tax=Huijunlia imazamoxiresistens TaxID=3127457 RepID=UPI00301723F1
MSVLNLAAQKQPPVLNHLALYVQDLARSTDFYRQVIGLDTVPEPFHDGRHTWLSVGGGQTLHLKAGAHAAAPKDKDHHMCFSVPSIEAFIARLQQANILFEDAKGRYRSVTTRADGILQIYLQDPDGYWIEINNDHPRDPK